MMDKIKQIISEVFNINSNSITNGMTPDDVELWDSLGQLILLNRIENEFHLTFELEEIFQIVSVGDIYAILENKNFQFND